MDKSEKWISLDAAKEALCPHDEDYDNPCISPHNLEIVLEQLAIDGGSAGCGVKK